MYLYTRALESGLGMRRDAYSNTSQTSYLRLFEFRNWLKEFLVCVYNRHLSLVSDFFPVAYIERPLLPLW